MILFIVVAAAAVVDVDIVVYIYVLRRSGSRRTNKIVRQYVSQHRRPTHFTTLLLRTTHSSTTRRLVQFDGFFLHFFHFRICTLLSYIESVSIKMFVAVCTDCMFVCDNRLICDHEFRSVWIRDTHIYGCTHTQSSDQQHYHGRSTRILWFMIFIFHKISYVHRHFGSISLACVFFFFVIQSNMHI